MVSEMLERYAFAGHEAELADRFINFEEWRREDEQRPAEERDGDAVVYKERISHSTDSMDSIQYRHDYLMEHFLAECPHIPLKDPQRDFSHHQRLAVFRRDGGCCQLRIVCNGVKCVWDNWHCDHIVPWSQGGSTSVDNGQVACPECNEKKGDSTT